MKLTVAFMVVFACSLFASCRDDYSICNVSKEVNFAGGFFQKQGNAEIAVAANNLTITPLSGNPVFYNQQTAVSVFLLPLNPLTDSVQYIIKIAQGMPQDTVSIVYKAVNTTIGTDCGNAYFFNLRSIRSTLNTVDSVKIIKEQVDNTQIMNAKVYF